MYVKPISHKGIKVKTTNTNVGNPLILTNTDYTANSLGMGNNGDTNIYMEYIREGTGDAQRNNSRFKIAIEDNALRPSLIECYTTTTSTDSNYKKTVLYGALILHGIATNNIPNPTRNIAVVDSNNDVMFGDDNNNIGFNTDEGLL